MQIPALQYAPGAKPPSRGVFVNVTPVAVDYAPQIDWVKVFSHICSYFGPFNLHLATFPYMTLPRCICEVEVSWQPFPGMPKGVQGATDNSGATPFLRQTNDYLRLKSYVFLEPILAGVAVVETQIQLVADAIAHEAVHWHVGPRHVQPSDGTPGVPNTSWLMAPGNARGAKILDNQSNNYLLSVLGPRV